MAFIATRDAAFYDTLRAAYVDRAEKPTYQELATEFNMPLGSVCSRAADEGWVTLRAARLERTAKESDALGVVLEAVKIDRTICAAAGDVILIAFRRLGAALESIPLDRAASTQVEIVNTASFAVKNLTDAAKNVGLTGLSKTLPGLGKEDNGRWNPEMLQQINVTVQNLTAQATAAAKGDAQSQAVEVRASEPAK